MKITYSVSLVKVDAKTIKELRLENDPILQLQFIKQYLNDTMRRNKFKSKYDVRVVDVMSKYNQFEEKFYFYVITAIEEESEDE